ncbi:hypothetical protein ACLK19_09690 [Escherichia coli]
MDNIDVFAARSQVVNSSRKSECGYLHPDYSPLEQTLWRTASRRMRSGTVFAGNVSHVPAEVPQYGTLLELVADVNLAVLENNPQLHEKMVNARRAGATEC